MNTYRPDQFQLLRVTNAKGTHYRVFGSWSGGFVDGDSWRLNSGVDSYKESAEGWIDFVGSSGSVYSCHKDSEGVRSLYNRGALSQILGSVPEGITVEEISYAEFKEEFDGTAA